MKYWIMGYLSDSLNLNGPSGFVSPSTLIPNCLGPSHSISNLSTIRLRRAADSSTAIRLPTQVLQKSIFFYHKYVGMIDHL